MEFPGSLNHLIGNIYHLYTTYILPSGGFLLPTTFYGNQRQPLTIGSFNPKNLLCNCLKKATHHLEIICFSQTVSSKYSIIWLVFWWYCTSRTMNHISYISGHPSWLHFKGCKYRIKSHTPNMHSWNQVIHSRKLTANPLKIGLNAQKGNEKVFLCHPFSGANLLLVSGRVILVVENHRSSGSLAPPLRQTYGNQRKKPKTSSQKDSPQWNWSRLL